jgi:hypothetical protein
MMNHSTRVMRRPRRASPLAARTAAAVIATAALVLLAAACSSSSPSSTGSGGSSTGSGGSPTAAGPPQSQELAFARCMRAHGVTDFPDSGGPLQPSPGSDLNINNPTYRAAQQVCRSLEPGGHLSPAQVAQNDTNALKFAKCMRNHGIIKYPDPIPEGGGGNEQINLFGIRNLLNTRQFHAAAQACRRYALIGK